MDRPEGYLPSILGILAQREAAGTISNDESVNLRNCAARDRQTVDQMRDALLAGPEAWTAVLAPLTTPKLPIYMLMSTKNDNLWHAISLEIIDRVCGMIPASRKLFLAQIPTPVKIQLLLSAAPEAPTSAACIAAYDEHFNTARGAMIYDLVAAVALERNAYVNEGAGDCSEHTARDTFARIVMRAAEVQQGM